MRFHTLKIKAVHQETPDCVSISLEVPAELQPEFAYRHGQYLTLRSHIEGKELRRSYSLCSAPHEGEWRVAIKRVPDGAFSTYAAHALKPGQEIDVMPPQGRFSVDIDPTATRHYLAFAAGSGITPILSIVKTILHLEPKSQVTLVYGNRGRHSIIFKEQLEALKNKHMGRMSLIHILSRETAEADLFTGRIDGDKTRALLDKLIDVKSIDQALLCGPEEMVLQVTEVLKERGLPADHIKFELFGTAPKLTKARIQLQHTEAQDTESQVVIRVDGKDLSLKMNRFGATILDAGLDAGTDLPYSCKNGMCSTCRAKVVEGSVEMEVNYSLEADDLAKGYVLTCQSRPTSQRVVVDYDA